MNREELERNLFLLTAAKDADDWPSRKDEILAGFDKLREEISEVRITKREAERWAEELSERINSEVELNIATEERTQKAEQILEQLTLTYKHHHKVCECRVCLVIGEYLGSQHTPCEHKYKKGIVTCKDCGEMISEFEDHPGLPKKPKRYMKIPDVSKSIEIAANVMMGREGLPKDK